MALPVWALMALQSHPARGAWIEIVFCWQFMMGDIVAPRKGCVD